MKIRGLLVEDLCVEKYDIFKNLVGEKFFSPSTKVYVHKTTIVLSIFEFTKVFHFIDQALLFCTFLWEQTNLAESLPVI